VLGKFVPPHLYPVIQDGQGEQFDILVTGVLILGENARHDAHALLPLLQLLDVPVALLALWLACVRTQARLQCKQGKAIRISSSVRVHTSGYHRVGANEVLKRGSWWWPSQRRFRVK